MPSTGASSDAWMKSGLSRKQLRKHKKQRIQRGWSEYDWWNADAYLLTVIADIADKFRTDGMGYPGHTTEAGWNATLDSISKPLRSYVEKKFDVPMDEADELYVAASNALHRFADNFASFWD